MVRVQVGDKDSNILRTMTGNGFNAISFEVCGLLLLLLLYSIKFLIRGVARIQLKDIIQVHTKRVIHIHFY